MNRNGMEPAVCEEYNLDHGCRNENYVFKNDFMFKRHT